MRVFLMIFIFLGTVFGNDIPIKTLQTKANVMFMTLINSNLYMATYNGSVEIYDIGNNVFKPSIVFDDVKNINGEILRPNILSIDEFNDCLLILAEYNDNKRALYLIKNGAISLVKPLEEGAKKALFLDDKTIIIGYVSNEISILDIESKSVELDFKISTALLADMKLNKDKSILAIATEGGKIYFYNTGKRQMQKVVDVHKDTMYAIDYKSEILATAGVDMSVAILSNNELKRLKAKTSVMGIALSNDGKTGAYVEDDLEQIFIFDTLRQTQVRSIKTPQNTINSIVFVSNDTIASSAFDKNIYFWKVK